MCSEDKQAMTLRLLREMRDDHAVPMHYRASIDQLLFEVWGLEEPYEPWLKD